jgi:hypothetical protein
MVSQGTQSISLGTLAGYTSQSNNSIAIGREAGRDNQGSNSIAMGYLAGTTNQPNNTIILNASGSTIIPASTLANTFTVNPVRNDTSNRANTMFYNVSTSEITYGPFFGNNTEIIFNDNGLGNGSNNLTFNRFTNSLTVGNSTSVTANIMSGGNLLVTANASSLDKQKVWNFGANGYLTLPLNDANTTAFIQSKGNINLSTPSSPGGSLVFTRASSEYLSLTTPITLGTNSFTVEFFVNFQSLVGFNTILSPVGSQNGFAIYFNTTNLVIDPGGAGVNNTWNLGATLVTNTWNYVVISRDVSTGKISAWLNGTRIGSDQTQCVSNFNGNAYDIGRLWFGNSRSAFTLTNLNVVVGSTLYSPSSTTITVPTSSIILSPNSKLLLLAKTLATATVDSSGQNTVINNDATWSVQSPYIPLNNLWTFGTQGELVLPATNLEISTIDGTPGESLQMVGTRKIVNGLLNTSPFAVKIETGGDAVLVYTTNEYTQSIKVTFVVQSNVVAGTAFNWEQFDLTAMIADVSGATVKYSISNRMSFNSTITDTIVTTALNGSNRIEIYFQLPTIRFGWVSFDATEFGLMVP